MNESFNENVGAVFCLPMENTAHSLYVTREEANQEPDLDSAFFVWSDTFAACREIVTAFEEVRSTRTQRKSGGHCARHKECVDKSRGGRRMVMLDDVKGE